MTAAQNSWNSKSDMVLPNFTEIAERGLYVPELEHDACGVGMVANISPVMFSGSILTLRIDESGRIVD